ncbi:MAG: hypothetical protein H6828_07045 [Planctomycetes bacterium]|nr:hypothetical protein [Planctomycetota bacterium]
MTWRCRAATSSEACEPVEDCEIAEACEADPLAGLPVPIGTLEGEHGLVIQVAPRVRDGGRIELETKIVTPDENGCVEGEIDGVHQWFTTIEGAPKIAPHPARPLRVERLLHGTEADADARMQKLHDVLIEAGPDGFDPQQHVEVVRKAMAESSAKSALQAHIEALKQKGDLDGAERVMVKLKSLDGGQHEVVDLAVPRARVLQRDRAVQERAALDLVRVRAAERADLESELKALRAKLEALESELAKRRAADGGAR